MGAEIATGLFGLAGVATGGMLTFAANMVGLRKQREQTVIARSHQLNDQMIAAHVEYLMRADVFYDRATALRTALCEGCN